jgi:DNA-binding transcriptional MerR regulator
MMEEPAVFKMHVIKEVASMVGETESTLRYWEGEFPDVIAPRRNKRDVRFYSEEDIRRVNLIKYLIRDCGLTLEGVRKRLKNDKGKERAVKHADVVRRLKDIKAELHLLKETMDEVNKKTLP